MAKKSKQFKKFEDQVNAEVEQEEAAAQPKAKTAKAQKAPPAPQEEPEVARVVEVEIEHGQRNEEMKLMYNPHLGDPARTVKDAETDMKVMPWQTIKAQVR